MTETGESAFADERVLVTGGSGMIGSRLVDRLARGGADVVVLDDFSSGYRWLLPETGSVRVVEGSVLDDETLAHVFRTDPDYVFHLAAHFANQNSVDHPRTDLRVNGAGTLKVLEYAHLTGVERFVYASSGCGVYGHDSELPFSESDVSLQLDTPYQVTKMVGELYANYFHNHYGLPVVNARFFNVFGPGEVPGRYRNVIPNFFYWASQGRDLPITGDGTESRDWTYVGDVVDGLLAMGVVDDAVGRPFNLATGTETRVVDMARAVLDRVDSDAELTFTERRSWDNKARIVGDIDRARSVLGYEPSVPFEAGLDEVSRWFETNRERIEACAEF